MKTPPDYVKSYVREASPDSPAELLADGSWCGHGEPEYVVFDVHDHGDDRLSVMLPAEPYPALCAVSVFRPGHEPFFIYDTRRHPASLYAQGLSEHPYHPADPHQCSTCGSDLFRISIGFEIPSDSTKPEDTSWFAMAVQCTKCGKKELLFEDETA